MANSVRSLSLNFEEIKEEAPLTISQVATTVYPSPFSDRITINYQSAIQVGDAVYTIADLSGRTLRSERIELATGVNNIPVNNLADLPAGNYVLRLQYEGQILLVESIVKQ